MISDSMQIKSVVNSTMEATHTSTTPNYLETPLSALRCYHAPLTAYLTVNKPPEGNHRESWYLYDVEFNGEVIVKNNKDAECETARVLLARGITGKVTMVDAKTGKPRTI